MERNYLFCRFGGIYFNMCILSIVFVILILFISSVADKGMVTRDIYKYLSDNGYEYYEGEYTYNFIENVSRSVYETSKDEMR